MNVDRLAVQGPAIREHLHAIDQRTDPVRLVGDQSRQLAILGGHRLLQQLGGAVIVLSAALWLARVLR